MRLDDKINVEGAKDNVLGIMHYHFYNKQAQEWMKQHFGRSGEMNWDPKDPAVRAVLNETAKIFCGTAILEAGLRSNDERFMSPILSHGSDSISKSLEVVGARTSSGIREDFVAEFEKNNPGHGVRPIIKQQDIALAVCPESRNQKYS